MLPTGQHFFNRHRVDWYTRVCCDLSPPFPHAQVHNCVCEVALYFAISRTRCCGCQGPALGPPGPPRPLTPMTMTSTRRARRAGMDLRCHRPVPPMPLPPPSGCCWGCWGCWGCCCGCCFFWGERSNKDVCPQKVKKENGVATHLGTQTDLNLFNMNSL